MVEIKTHTYFYRPIWTCGRYDKETQSAIYYNLIEGLSYFFEDHTAILIGIILSHKRGEQIALDYLVGTTGISIESLNPFIDQLVELHLLSIYPMSSNLIASYRLQVRNCRIRDSQKVQKQVYADVNKDTSERCYAERTKNRVISIMFELTYNCSEKCIHCYNPGASRNDSEPSERSKYKFMSLDNYKRIIDECYDEGMIKICLSGGDPFSNPYIWEILDYLYEKDIAIELFTNGQKLIGFENKIANYFPCVVGLSLYSGTESVHDRITRIPGSYKKTISVLSALSCLAVPLEIKCCVMQTNFTTYYQVADIARKYTAFFQLQCAIFDSFDGDRCVSRYLRLSPEQMEVVLCDINNPLYVGVYASNYGEKELCLNENACYTGTQAFCITPTGNLILCCSFHAELGNLNTESLSSILSGNIQLEKWQNITLESYEECGRHDYCSFCKICPGLNFSEHGTPLKAAENNCYVAKIRYSLASKLKKGYDPLKGKSIADFLKSCHINQLEIKKERTKDYFDYPLKI